MLAYCLKCKEDTKSVKNWKKVNHFYYQNVPYAVIKNQDLWKHKKEKGLSSLALKTPWSKISLLGKILF